MEYKVWSEFQFTKNDGTVCKCKVQDCPKDRLDDAVDLFKYFFRDEAVHKLSGIPKSKEALEECERIDGGAMKEERMHIAVCIEDASNLVIGASWMNLKSIKDEVQEIKPKTKEVAKKFEMISAITNMCNVPKIYNVEEYYEDEGIIVHPNYRGFGIGSRLIESRRNICKERGVPLTSAWMTSVASQKAAERDGWETAFEIDTREFSKKLNVTPFEGIATTFKIMVVNLTGK